MGEETDRYNPDLIDGVVVRWINPGRAARDEIAFRHALKTAHRLRAAGERMTDAAIIDAYERAYKIDQRESADGRTPEMPPMRDRQTMARRVRGYVTQGKTDSYGTPSARYATTSQNKATPNRLCLLLCLTCRTWRGRFRTKRRLRVEKGKCSGVAGKYS